MSKLSRKIKRKNRLSERKSAKKEVNKKLGNLQGLLDTFPKKCRSCSAKFNPKKDLDTWKVEVFSDRVLLLCEPCFKKLRDENVDS